MARLPVLPRLIAHLALLATVLLAVAPPAHAELVKSPSDTREYRTFVLPNGLRVLLISDSAADKAAASLDVYVGSGSDPEDRPGLAHFLEHMLFLGTSKYPRPDEYQAFISAHGGSHNAYTSFEHTNFFFDIDSGFLEPALDRFAQFFISPLFSEEYVSREKHAVHSEYQARMTQDGRREFEAMQQAMNPRHPESRFSIGSLETLADRPGSSIRDQLIHFYESHYSANIMTLAVLGRESLPVLEKWVRERFSEVPNRHASPLDIDVPLFGGQRLPARLDVVPLKDERELTLTFPVPPLQDHWRSKPVQYIANLVGHEGEGSLLSVLKHRGWAERLSAGTGIDNRDAATFDVTIGLTEEGLGHVNEIVSDVFDYIRLVSDKGILQRIYDEQRKLSEIAFRFQEQPEPMHYVTSLSSRLQIYPAEQVLHAPYAMEDFEPALIRRYLDRLTPQNVLVTLVAKGRQTDAETRWFHTPYRLARLEGSQVRHWAGGTIPPALAIPAPNPFVPENLAVKPARDETEKPRHIVQRPGFDLWYQQDDTYHLPRANFFFSLRSPLANDTPRDAVLTHLYVKLVNDALDEFAYPAKLAGLDYSLYPHIRGISVRISGYDDKEHLLLARVVHTLRTLEVDPDRFAIFKEQLARSLRNTRKDTPYSQAMKEISDLLLMPHWTEQEQLEALGPLNAGDLREFIPRLLARMQIVALAHGNLYEKDALRLAGIVEGGLLAGAEPVDVPPGRVVKLPPERRLVRNLDIDQSDSAIALYLQGSEKSYATRARFALLAQLLSAPFYSELRTEQQLGYVVFVRPMTLLEVPGLAFIVQSPVAGPVTLEDHILGFLHDFDARVQKLDARALERQKESVLSRVLEKEETLDERSSRYWTEIDREEYGFDSREKLAAAVRALDLQDLRQAYRTVLDDAQRSRLVVRSAGSGEQAAEAAAPQTPQTLVLRDPGGFKREQQEFPR